MTKDKKILRAINYRISALRKTIRSLSNYPNQQDLYIIRIDELLILKAYIKEKL